MELRLPHHAPYRPADGAERAPAPTKPAAAPRKMPRDIWPESTLALRLDPYRFISERCQRFGSDAFRARLLLRETICLSGRAGAELFYDRERFTRLGAAPEPLVRTLFGRGGVQMLEGEAHRHRKQMFLAIAAPERVRRLGEVTAGAFRAAAERWASQGRVVLYDELRELLTRAACDWAGVPLPEAEVGRRTREISALFDQAGSAGPGHLWSRVARRHADAWAARLVRDVRAGRLSPPAESALHVVAHHRGLGGRPLRPRVAAVELLNVLRPTVAVSVFVTFAAHALHEHPECRALLQKEAGEGGYSDLFAQEVRRYYPFFPAVMAKVRRDFEWQGYRFRKGTRAMLDLYGINHDPRIWSRPEEFHPERFHLRNQDPFGFVPQGGGDARTHHRCPGEGIALEIIKVALGFLSGGIAYDVPEQDLRIDFRRLPALPRSRFVIENVRHRPG
ncbi:MAG TPA: cytochrome P450 [Polyangiaceae bacterium]|nr:cytochrome P450 [Polyangiaceae bacterium]